MKKIKSYYLIEVFFEGFVIIKLCSIVELCKLEYDFHDFGLVLSREAVVTFAAKDSLYALIHHVRTDRIESMVKCRVEICVLVWHDYNRFVILDLLRLVGFQNGPLNILPDIGSVVPVQINYLLSKWVLRVFIEVIAVEANCVQIILVSFRSDNIDCLMHTSFRVLIAIFLLVSRQNTVVGDFGELKHEF